MRAEFKDAAGHLLIFRTDPEGDISVSAVKGDKEIGMLRFRRPMDNYLSRETHRALRAMFGVAKGEKEQFSYDIKSNPLPNGPICIPSNNDEEQQRGLVLAQEDEDTISLFVCGGGDYIPITISKTKHPEMFAVVARDTPENAIRNIVTGDIINNKSITDISSEHRNDYEPLTPGLAEAIIRDMWHYDVPEYLKALTA